MKKIFILLLIAVGIASCDDFLDVTPGTQVSEKEFYKTEEEVLMGVYAIIDNIQYQILDNIFSMSTILSDEAETGGGIGEGSFKETYDKFMYGPTTDWIPSWWNQWDLGMYPGIVNCNILVEKVNESGLDPGFVSAIDAEARFYRALFYYYMFAGYEQFPLITNVLSVSDIYSVTKADRKTIYEFILSDLDDNVTRYLPSVKEMVKGRTNRDAAKLLRAKLILFQKDESRYQQALDDMAEIIGSGRYTLVSNYADIWLPAGEFNTESIYEIEFAGNNTEEGNPLSRAMGGRGLIDPRSAEQGGLSEGWGQCTVPGTVYNMFKPGDTRREGTIIDYKEEMRKVDALVAAGQLPAGSAFMVSEQQENFEWFGHFKHTGRKGTYGNVNPLYNYAINYRFYRYAEILLLGTELQARITGSVNAAGQDWFNQIRDRAYKDTNHRIDLTGKSKDEVLDLIFEERGYEFCYEMQRWFDIMRFDKGAEILGPKGWKERFRFFPISQNEMDASQGRLTQNPGWL